MSELAWLLIPLVATVLAVVWVMWRGRPRGPADPLQSVTAYSRYLAALGRHEGHHEGRHEGHGASHDQDRDPSRGYPRATEHP